MPDSKAIETQGVQIFWEGVKIGEIVSFSGPGGSANVIDVTSLDSTAKEKLMGLPDEGQLTFEMNLVPGDLGQIDLRTARVLREKKTVTVHLTDTSGTILTFDAYCLGFSLSGGVDNVVRASVTLEIDGEVNWSPRLKEQTAYNAGTGVLVLDLVEDEFAAALNSELVTNWNWGYGDSGLVIDTVARTSATRATLTYTTAGGQVGSHVLTIQAKAAALAGSFPTGILSVPIAIPA